MGKKLGKRAFFNRLKQLGPDRWIRGKLVLGPNEPSRHANDGVSSQHRYCDLGWMGKVHGFDLLSESGISSQLSDIYDIPHEQLSLIPAVNDSAETWEENLEGLKLLFDGKIDLDAFDGLTTGAIKLGDVFENSPRYQEYLKSLEEPDEDYDDYDEDYYEIGYDDEEEY